MSDASKAAKARYKAKTIKTFYLDLNTNTDADIIAWLDEKANHGQSKSAEIKRACRRMKPHYSSLDLDGWKCPFCPAKYTPYPGRLISYCPRCGQAIINATGKSADSTPVDTDEGTSTPVDMDAGTSTPVDMDEGTSTPVDMDAGTSTPVDMDAGTSTPVDTNTDTSAPVDNYRLYLITYTTKKGGIKEHTDTYSGRTKREAEKGFREWHKKAKERSPHGEGHAFNVKASDPV